jgi:acyl dehydratase
MSKVSGVFMITWAQNETFARVSGDYNPLHVDPVYARRLQFGHPVIHGVHHFLRAWDEALAGLPEAARCSASEISVSFPGPAQVDREIGFECEYSDDPQALSLSAVSEGRQVLNARIRLEPPGVEPTPEPVETVEPPREQAFDRDFPSRHVSGSVPLCCDPALAQALFPRLVNVLPPRRLAQVLATTRVVGMRAPGLHSIFSRLNLAMSPDAGAPVRSTLDYSEQRADARVQQLTVAVESAGCRGSLVTFFRPRPVEQPSFATVARHVADDCFVGRRAWVVGGSRGAGEVTAKILAAGGADVVITYNRGREEAEKVAGDIVASGGSCRAMLFNVLDAQAWPEGLDAPTHVYYFASPHIDANRSAAWDIELFARYSAFYLTAFNALVAACMDKVSKTERVEFFYPSSVYVDQPERGFSEYATAKGAGETLCVQLAARYPNAGFLCPRLPRMATDQTAGIIPVKCDSVMDVMLKELGVGPST